MPDPQALWSEFRETLSASLYQARTAMLEQLAELRTLLISLHTQQGWHAARRAAQPLFVFAGAYIAAWSYLFIAAFLGAKPPPAPLFPPGAVLLCALLLAPPRRWWLYLLAAFLIQVPILAYLQLPLWWNLVGFIPDAIEPILAVLLLRRYLGLPLRFASLREVSIYTACVAFAVVVAATVGAGVNAAAGQPYGNSWQTWFLGDTLSDLILVPVFLLWIAANIGELRTSAHWRYAEVILLYGGLLVLSIVVLDTRLFGAEIAGAAIYLPVPLFLWAAVRFGPRGIATALSLVVILAIPAVANALGPFANVSIPAPSLLAQVFQLQLYLLMIGVPLIFLAAIVQELKRADAAVRVSEERFRDVVEAQTELISRYLPDTTLTFVNGANCRSMGLSREQMLGTKFIDLLPESAREPLLTTIQALLAHPGVATTEHQKRTSDGSLRWEQWVNRAILDEQGRVTELQGIGRDITERKQMEQALRASEARYRAAFESAVTGMMLVSIDGHPLHINRPMVEMLGYTEEEVRTLTFADFTYPDDLEPNLTLLKQAVAGEIDGYQLEKRFIHKHGHTVWGVLSAAMVRDEAGNPLYLVGQLEDISERHQLEREREEARAQAEQRAEELDRIFEQSAEGLAVFDQHGRQLRSNLAYQRLLGLDTPAANGYAQLSLRERFALLTIRDEQGRLLAPEEGPLGRALAGEVVAGGRAMDLQVHTLDGREVKLRVSAAPLRTSTGQLVGALGIYRDVTERKRLEHEREEARASALALREVNERLDTFVTMAAHDLRSPVVLSRMEVRRAQQVLEQAAEGVRPGSGKQAKTLAHSALALEMTAQNLERLWRLVQQLLDVASVREGTLVLNRQPFDLGDLVYNCVEEQRLLSPSRVIEVNLPGLAETSATAHSRSIRVDGDAERLWQVMANYLSNAERYSAEDQPIIVTLRLEAEEAPGDLDANTGDSGAQEDQVQKVARVEVHDQGVGIAEEDQATIWNRFQRATSVQEASGLGLGLYIVRTIVELHGGHVGIASALGQGSTFWFTVPLLDMPTGTALSHESPND